MSKKNYTGVTEFILLGLTDRAELQPVLFVVFLAVYLTTVVGNVSMILLIRSDSRLHTPMYFFLSHLSFLDLCYATNVTPQMLVNFLSKRKTISVIGCFIQFHFFIALVITDYYMLTVMAFDRYMAICKPLLYGSKMSRSVCISLVVIPYTYGFANGLVQTILMLRLSFCGPNEINHFYCADPPLLVLACSDTSVKETAIKMPITNGSEITEFILLGLTGRPELQPLLFVLFLVVYLVTLLSNLGMILLIRLDSRLHTPMYFFLSNLAFVDLCYTSNATLQMLTNFLSEKKTITFAGCFTQCYIFIALLLTELYMLAAMAYDRYVAICNPLRYSVKMSRQVCICLATCPYVYGFSDGLLQAILTFSLTFCRSNIINHFYCADPPLIKLSCSDTYVKEHAMLISAGFNLSSSLTIILVSYAFIIAAILQIKSAEGRQKAFSTCGSHMIAVTLFYGTLFCMYVRPPTDKTVEESKIIAVFYTFVNPVLNPLIYSMRNKDVKQALKDVLRRNMVTTMAMPPLSNKP
ncbi:olfactory receptor 5M11 [Pteronotus mesoamericanus]|uniref:olfactory receptor 5M11 n=1 Tax=Pteronotus mesoamericanus TaxID=1884717 RepID=UPI0023EC8611|nr:olfactory receptor 5M11 [Pteronotus parnellii mesoamericanus]